ncbi:MAG: 2-oxo acid dehydrogenase subunit E2 [Bryobacteraceae bacterium]
MRQEKLDHADRWLRDGLQVCQPPAFFISLDADMTRSKAALERLRHDGIRATYTHVLVRAAALALARHPDLHQLVCGTKRYRPDSIDIGLSVAGETFVAPIMVLAAADRKSLAELAAEISERAAEVKAADAKNLAMLRKLGWLIPFAFLRRAVIRLLMSRVSFRRKGAGTFQVSSAINADVAVPFTFTTTAILCCGRVRDRVVAVDGEPAVRPVLTLVCCVDHRVWDGRASERFLTTVKEIMEAGEFVPGQHEAEAAVEVGSAVQRGHAAV